MTSHNTDPLVNDGPKTAATDLEVGLRCGAGKDISRAGDGRSALDIDLFAGPGGWDHGALRLGLRPVGIEWNRDACLTAVAAGHLRIQADVSRYPTTHLRRKVRGLIASAPCTPFSAAGNGAGKHVMALLATRNCDTALRVAQAIPGCESYGRTDGLTDIVPNPTIEILYVRTARTHTKRS